MLFIHKELMKPHKTIFHLASDKLFNFRKFSKRRLANSGTKAVIKEGQIQWDTCKKYSPIPIRIAAAMLNQNDLLFGEKLFNDLTLLDWNDVLHIMNTATHFQLPFFWGSMEDIWTT